MRPHPLTRLLTLLALALLPISAGAQERPLAPAEVPEAVSRAESLLRDGTWNQAIAAWSAITRANPYNGRYWSGLATAAVAAGELDAAERAVEHYIEVGGITLRETRPYAQLNPARWSYRMAQLQAGAGQKERALYWLGRAVQLGYPSRVAIAGDSAFAAYRGDPAFQHLAAIPTAPDADRVAQWRSDIDLLFAEIERLHPQPYRHSSRQRVRLGADSLLRRLPSLSDDQAVIALQRLLRQVGDAHTGFIPEVYRGWPETLPLQFETDGDAVWVVAADSAAADLVGGRLVEVGQRPAAEAFSRLDSIASTDNTQGFARTRLRNLRFPQLLHALGISAERDRVRLVVRHTDGRTVSRVVPAARQPPGYRRPIGDPAWVAVYRGRAEEAPLYLQNRWSTYWFRYLPQERLVYAAINGVVNDPAESFAAFTQRLLAFVDSAAVDRLVVDVRWNNGGNSLLLPPLINGLVASRLNREGRLFLLTSHHTFSAGVNLVTLIERNTAATLIGEPPPSDPNFIGESNIFMLPATGIPISISNQRWQSSWPIDARRWSAPAIYVPLRASDMQAGRDPAMDAIRALSRDRSGASGGS